MADEHHRILGIMERPVKKHFSLIQDMVDLVFVLIWFPSMGEIQIICYMYIDEAGIPMLVTMSKRIM